MGDRSKSKGRKKGTARVKNEGGGGVIFRFIDEVKRRYRNEAVFTRPNGLCEKRSNCNFV